MNKIIQKSDCANQTWTKLRAKIIASFCIANYASKICKNLQMCLLLQKTTLIFFQNSPIISLAKKRKKRKWQNPPLLI